MQLQSLRKTEVVLTTCGIMNLDKCVCTWPRDAFVPARLNILGAGVIFLTFLAPYDTGYPSARFSVPASGGVKYGRRTDRSLLTAIFVHPYIPG